MKGRRKTRKKLKEKRGEEGALEIDVLANLTQFSRSAEWLERNQIK